MKFLIILFIILSFAQSQRNISLCMSFNQYQTCINSQISKCFWDQVQNVCKDTQDFLLGCNQNLNRLACVSQIGDIKGNYATCRFINKCEQIPNVEKEDCLNNLSKYGCLSITNSEQICFWQDNKCLKLEIENWSIIQQNFDEVIYSQSACAHIEHFFIMHHLMIWKLFNYTPNLLQEDDLAYLSNYGIYGNNTKDYSDPTSIFLQNNIEYGNGKFLWYNKGESKSVNLRNLRLSDRYREGCIALEIENDNDFQTIFSLNEQVTGINRIYCQYLNRMLNTDPYYIFFKGKCQLYEQKFLNDQTKIKELNLICQKFNTVYCIHFNSLQQSCQISGDEFEYSCQPINDQVNQDCSNSKCTEKQCQQLIDYYIDSDSHSCVKNCFEKTSKFECETQINCIYLGAARDQYQDFQLICSPLGICDQPGISFSTCQNLKAKCQWNETLQICYTLQDEELLFLKCTDVINNYACTFITLSDQLCFWSQPYQKCLNQLDQPILVAYQYFLDYIWQDQAEYEVYMCTQCNKNLCKSNQLFYTEYNESQRLCQFWNDVIVDDLTIINKEACLNTVEGFCFWNQHYQICECYPESHYESIQCSNLYDINEKCCQFAQVSNKNRKCIFDKKNTICKEEELQNLDQLECSGNGLSEDICLKKEFCIFKAYLCEKLSGDYINSLTCQSFHLVNGEICKYHNRENQLCDFNSVSKSCYSPSQMEIINYGESLNRFACERVNDVPVFYNVLLNTCIIINEIHQQLYQTINCEGNFLNQQACKLVQTDGQICYWNKDQKKCKLYMSDFSFCSDYQDQSEKLCKGLIRDFKNILITENFCQFTDNQCLSSSNILQGCGENELMNINRCNSLTGLDDNQIPIQMCAFINLQCTSLDENDYQTSLILNEISCNQANLATCTKVATPGQFCIIVNNKIQFNLVFDLKCNSFNNTNLSCQQLNQYNKTQINKTFCSQATDGCYYDENYGCVEPSLIDLNCDIKGLSFYSCINNTRNQRCAFLKNKCQYLSEDIQLMNCNLLNNFLCNNYQYQQCIWKENQCQEDIDFENIQKYVCSRQQNETFLIYQDNKCVELGYDNLQMYLCDQEGLNYYSCTNIKNHYCIFIQNQCQFYKNILCEDNQTNCKDTNSGNQMCVLYKQKCFGLKEISEYECDEFDETNYEFCYRYPNCIYDGVRCKSQQPSYIYEFCEYQSDIIDCVFHNLSLPCMFDIVSTQCLQVFEDENQSECPQFLGFYSEIACTRVYDCFYGYTKSGKGFCYSDNILDVKCEQLPLEFCLEDLSHYNLHLNCYYDGFCKTLQAFNYNCQFLNQYQSNYSACLKVKDCLYSLEDHICKSTQQFTEIICQGQTVYQCSQIQNICYFNGQQCVNNGEVFQLNKYGCLQQNGYWQFKNYNCQQLNNDQIVQSCYLISKNLCLSQATNQLQCRWLNNQCEQIFEFEGKLIDSCLDLNERACFNIRLSSVQCIWNSIQNKCLEREIHTNDCSYISSTKVSLSLCGNQIGQPCIRSENGLSCQIFNIQLNDCTKYGLNKIGCIQNTTKFCQWKTVNDGGFCDEINQYVVLCNEGLNKNACQNVQTKGQFCYWNSSLNQCENKILTDCESASNLNGKFPCNAITQAQCMYDDITKECITLTSLRKGCLNNYNKIACLNQDYNCIWKQNECIEIDADACSQLQNRKFCLSSKFLCEWQTFKCVQFILPKQKIHCENNPLNVSDGVCSSNSIDPCIYDPEVDRCSPQLKQYFYSITLLENILSIQDTNFVSPLLTAECYEFKNQQQCIKSRKSNQSCVWNEGCQSVVEFEKLDCTNNLNIFGCLNIKQRDKYCMWQGKCFDWDFSYDSFTNVNINVCKEYTINKIFQNYSCFALDIDQIKCDDLGVGKLTCLSITKQQCKWDEDSYICQKFEYQGEKNCSDYQQVSPLVCQMQETDSCVFDKETKNCTQALRINLEGISKQACLQINQYQVFWNGEVCMKQTEEEDCQNNKQVNSLSCTTRIQQPCLYDRYLSICTSHLNIQSLRCSTEGLNLLGCVLVQSEPCIFSDGKCTQFTNYQKPCNKLVNVNEKVCSSIQSEQCEYNEIEFTCQSPKLPNSNCNIKGINKLFCLTNEMCTWNPDYSNCICQSNKLNIECFFEKEECLKNQLCIYENAQCRLKYCLDLKPDDCLNQYLAGAICYLNNYGECQPAVKCEDIINFSLLCSTIYINSSQCVQGYNKCYSYNNFEKLCPQSNCLQIQCIQEYGLCRKKICSDFELKECNIQDGCYLKQNGVCEDLLACFQINEEIYGEQAGQLCNQLSKNGVKCNWQSISIAEDKKICTNQYCQFYGSSLELCQGNEINSVSCTIKNNFICQSCEEINDECYCNTFQNICKYEKGICISLLCSSFQNQDECQSTYPRCYWSTKNQSICLISCPKIINIDECNNRLDECYYDYVAQVCKNGSEIITELNIEVDIEQFSAKISLTCLVGCFLAIAY